MKIFQAALKILSIAILLAGSIITWAQEFDFNKLPVLNPQPDFNGVDATSGSFTATSPFQFNSPGAGNLNFEQVFNGRTESVSLNVYLDDHTYLPSFFTGDPESERYIRIHIDNTDKLFWCGISGECVQDVKKDGVRLVRVSKTEYIFFDKKGTEYKFFPLSKKAIDSSCYDPSGMSGCNRATYMAYAPVKFIIYSSGEKLTFNDFSSVKVIDGKKYVVDNIQSNLGYQIELESSVATAFTPQTVAGWNWDRYRHMGVTNDGESSQTKFTLYRNSERINTLTTNRTWSATDSKLFIVKQTDDLGRSYQIDFHGGYVYHCGIGEYSVVERDNTVMLPIRMINPSGLTSEIQYHMVNPSLWYFKEAEGDGSSVPVFKVLRDGNTWEYDNNAVQKSLKDPNAKIRKVEFSWLTDATYDSYGNNCPKNAAAVITSYQDELNRRSDYSYDGSLLDQAELPEGNSYAYKYDVRGNIATITQLAKPGSTETNRVVFRADYPLTCDSNNYKYCNKPSWVETAKGYRTDYTYSAAHGGVQTVTQPSQRNGIRPKITYSYSNLDTGDGVIWRNTGISQCIQGASCTGTANEIKTTITYLDKTFLPKSRLVAAGNGSISATENYTYNAAGLMTSSTDALGQTSYLIYDLIGRKIGEISADPDGTGPLARLATRTIYNNDNNPTRIAKGTVTGTDLTALNSMVESKYTVITYDNLGRKNSDARYSNGQIFSLTQFSYDAWNRIICTAKRLNFSSAPQDACVLGSRSIDGYDRITKNEYDDAGQLVKVYQAYGTPIEQVYSEFEYSGNGKRTVVVDANRNKSLLKYDGYDRQTHWYFPSKTKGAFTHSTTDFEQYGYDLNDNRTMLRKRDGLIFTYEYDNLDRVYRKTVPESGLVAASHTQDIFYGYDNRGLELFSRFGSETGQGVTQTWDIFGKPLSSTSNLDGVARNLTYKNNLKGVRTHVTHPDGQQFIYGHDNLYRLKSIDHSSAGVLASYTYDNRAQLDLMNGGISTDFGYDGIGRVTSLVHDLAGTANDNAYTYGYNPVSQLLSLTTSNTNYTPVNGQQAQNYQVNGLNQYTNVNGVAFAYDANGNLTFDGQTRYSYDPENRLVKATNTSGALKAEFWYDPMGRLNKIQNTSTTTQFLYDGDELVAEFSGTSTTVAQRYVHGIATDDPVAWFQGASVSTSTKRHLRSNHQGSIVAVSDSAGNMLHLPRYDNWGKPQSIQPLRFGYTGQAWISELGLWHYKARVYSPQLGRFLQTDPVGYEDQINLYAYVGNDPVNKIDSTGQFTQAYSNSLVRYADHSRTTQGRVATLTKAASDVKEMGAVGSGLGDAVSIIGTATAQAEVVALGTAMSTASTVAANSFSNNITEAAAAQAAGEVGGKVGENAARAAANAAGVINVNGRVPSKTLGAISDTIGMAGNKGKVAEGIITAVNVTAEFASQQASGVVIDKMVDPDDKN